MEKQIRIYHKDDPQQYEDEKAYWKSQSPEKRLEAAEQLRRQYMNLKGIDADQGLQRVYKFIKREKR